MATGAMYLIRDILMAVTAFSLALKIDPIFQGAVVRQTVTPVGAELLRWFCWAT